MNYKKFGIALFVFFVTLGVLFIGFFVVSASNDRFPQTSPFHGGYDRDKIVRVRDSAGESVYGDRYEKFDCYGFCRPYDGALAYDDEYGNSWYGNSFPVVKGWLMKRYNDKVIKTCLDLRHEDIIESKIGDKYMWGHTMNVHERFRKILSSFCISACEEIELNHLRDKVRWYEKDFCYAGEQGDGNVRCKRQFVEKGLEGAE